jgi:hypothetical protein
MSENTSKISETTYRRDKKRLGLPLGFKVTSRTNNSRLALALRVLFLQESYRKGMEKREINEALCSFCILIRVN